MRKDFFLNPRIKTNPEDAFRYDLNHISQVPQFEDVKFEAASLLSELYCQQVSIIYIIVDNDDNLYPLGFTDVPLSSQVAKMFKRNQSVGLKKKKDGIFLYVGGVNILMCLLIWLSFTYINYPNPISYSLNGFWIRIFVLACVFLFCRIAHHHYRPVFPDMVQL